MTKFSYKAIKEFPSWIVNLPHRLNVIESRMSSLENRINDNENRINDNENRINEVKRDIDFIKNIVIPDISLENPDSKIEIKDYFDYYNFEEVFRGSEELIKQRQKNYLPLFKNKRNIVDLGSGRGEFLEILKENGLNGIGIDFDAEMVAQCQEKGLNVSYGDLVDYLIGCPDESIEGIFSSQVIEHLSFEKIDQLIRTAFKKLKNDGIFAIETINPYNILSFRLFYLDPSHQKPLFPEFIRFICISSGFEDVMIKFITLNTDLMEADQKEQLNKWICGDYAIIARKNPIKREI